MASGGRKEFLVQKDTDGELPNAKSENARLKTRGTRMYESGRGRSFERGGSNTKKREDGSQNHFREVHATCGRGVGGTFIQSQRRASGDGFQLEPANGRRAHSNTRPRQRQEYDERNVHSTKLSVSKKPPEKLSGHRKEQQHRSVQEGRQEVLVERIKRCEEKVSESLQYWKGDQASYHSLETQVASLWSQYQCLVLRNVEQAVKENLSWRIWRSSQYPIIEVLRKSGQRR